MLRDLVVIRGARTAAAIAVLALAAGFSVSVLRRGPGDEIDASAASRTRVTPHIAPDAPGEDLFEDVTAAAGIDFVHRVGDGLMNNILESAGSGAAWFDADGDGRLDLYLVQSAWVEGVSQGERPRGAQPVSRLYRNRGDGTFEDVTERAGIGRTAFGFAAVSADYDGDGDADLYTLNLGGNVLWRNRGDGTFEDATETAGVRCGRCSLAAVFLDADGDADLDLYVANYLTFDPKYRLHYSPDVFPGPLAFVAEGDVLYLNRGDGTFADGTSASGIGAITGRAMGVVATDFDADGRTDVYVSNDASANQLWHNLGGGKFAEVALRAGVAFGVQGEATASMTGVVGDVDGDLLPDLHVTDSSYGSLYRNRGKMQFDDRIVASGIAAYTAQWAAWGGGFLDVDLDGDLDLFHANGDMHHPTGRPDLLLENRGDGRFDDLSRAAGAYFRAEMLSRGGAIADFDDDGDADLLVTTIGDRPVLLRHRGVPGRHWVAFDLRGHAPNTDALGARVVIETVALGEVRRAAREKRLLTGYLTQGDPRLHFGLADTARVGRAEVTWPDGSRQEFRDLGVDRIWRLTQGGSIQ